MRIIIETDDGYKTTHEISHGSAPGNAPAGRPDDIPGTAGATDGGPAPTLGESTERGEPGAFTPGAPITQSQEAESGGVAPTFADPTSGDANG